MTEHLSKPQLERFCLRALSKSELISSAQHFAECDLCRRQFQRTLELQREGTAVRFTLAPEAWLRHEHLEYEQLVALADNTMDGSDRELVDLHLKVCARCGEDVHSFLAFREQIEPELAVSYAPAVSLAQQPRATFSGPTWWRGLAWKPIYATTVLIIAIAVIAALLLLRRGADTFQAQQNTPPQVNPDVTSPPSPPDTDVSKNELQKPVQTPANQLPRPEASPAVAVRQRKHSKKNDVASGAMALHDRRGTIILNTEGSISGLDNLPSLSRRQVAEALLAQRIERPSVLKQLAAADRTLRGSPSSQSFRLLSPAGTVIVDDRPVFVWKPLSGASNYRVYVTDSAGHIVVKSVNLAATRTEWTANAPLKRGEIYSWAVTAVVDGKEIVSPGPAAPEIKFQVLSSSDFQELTRLRRTGSHLVLGVFYGKVGMLSDAEREFQALLRLNPRSKIATKLLGSVIRLQIATQ